MMFEKEQLPLNIPFDTASESNEQPVSTSFLQRPYYAAFLQQLGLREIKDQVQYLLTQRDAKNWKPALEEVASAMQQLCREGDLTWAQALAVLEFVIAKLDRNKTVAPCVGAYMCHDGIRRTVLRMFNESIGSRYTDLTELSCRIADHPDEANETFNAIRICDPAMGSGFFLIQSLNEMIAVKSQLGILSDRDGNPLFPYRILVHDGKLVARDKRRSETIELTADTPESRRIQDTLMKEKQTLIEHCLFGVDIDPIAVTIARIRLWIEVLKHLCRDDSQPLSLPLIEPDLRCGDALVSRISIYDDLKPVFQRIGYSVSEYKMLADDYKKARTAEEKNTAKQMLAAIKRKLLMEITWDDKNNEELLRWQRELATLKAPSLFEMNEEEVKAVKARLLNTQSMVDKYKQKIEDSKNNPIFKHAIEWHCDFPQLLDESADFTGFHLIIGNPPDTLVQIGGETIDIYKQFNYRAYKRTGEVSSLFYELGNKLLKPEYYLSYIASSGWMKSVQASKMRQYLMEETNPLLTIEFSDSCKIDKTLADHGIVILQKTPNRHRTLNCCIKSDFDPQTSDWERYLNDHATYASAETATDETQSASSSTTSFVILTETERHIRGKIEQTGTPLEAWDIQLYSGIRTGLDEAFIIDGATKDEFILADYKNVDILKPLLKGEDIRRYIPEKSDQWLIYVPWHFPLLYDRTITMASERAEQRFRQQYPVIYEHLAAYRSKLAARDAAEVGVSFEWYALQNYATSNEWDDFTQQKIVWKRETSASAFCLDYRGCATLDTTCFATGQHLKYLLGVLNSKLGRYMLQDAPHLPNGDMQISVLTLEALKIPIPNIKVESEVISLVNKRTSDVHKLENEELDGKIDRLVYEMYDLNEEERRFIDSNISHT
ncbi:Eco57I restriction-modification methylase domain-containing protein [Tannerella forsythia]|nr:hypothetical protein [Tannerella forsythia]